jgi:acyl dehydratase
MIRSAAHSDQELALTLPAITHETLIAYADASGDRNPLHIDPAAARAAGEPDVIAHGMLLMAYVGRLVTELFPQSALSSWHLRFVAKTPVGAQPTCHARIIDHIGDLARAEIWAELDDGTVVTRGEAVYTVRRVRNLDEH